MCANGPGRSDYALVVGESLVDLVTDERGHTQERAGGSAANVAVALARLDRPVRLVTSLGRDRRGEMLHAHLAGAGVELVGEPRRLRRTSTARARIGPDGAATYDVEIEWPLIDVASGPERPLFVHVGSLAAVLAPGAEGVRDLVAACRGSAWISYDVNVRPDVTGTGPEVIARVEEVAAIADLVKASDDDLLALYPDLHLEAAAHRLRDLGPVVVVTQGAQGLFALGDDGRVEAPAAPVLVADTIGAGDSVSAALIDALWPIEAEDPGWDDADQAAVLRHAARAAAVTSGRVGADPPYRADLTG